MSEPPIGLAKQEIESLRRPFTNRLRPQHPALGLFMWPQDQAQWQPSHWRRLPSKNGNATTHSHRKGKT